MSFLNAGCARRFARLNPDLPPEALDDAYRKLTAHRCALARRAEPCAASDAGRRRDGRIPAAGRLDRRRAGAGYRFRDAGEQRLAGGQPVHASSRAQHTRRPDVVLFVNGLPLGVIELKNAGRRKRRRSGRAFSQLQTYQDANPVAVHVQRGAGRLGRRRGADRRRLAPSGNGSCPGGPSRARGRADGHARAAGR